MKQKAKAVLAAEQLYAGSGKCVCAVSSREPGLPTLWATDENAELFAGYLRTQLSTAANGTPVPPADGLIALSGASPAQSCRVEQFPESDPPFWLLHFTPSDSPRRSTPPEVRATVRTVVDTINENVAMIRQSISGRASAQDRAFSDYLSAQASCFALRSCGTRLEELLWYEQYSAEDAARTDAVSVTEILSECSEDLKESLRKVLTVQTEVADDLYARVMPARLRYAVCAALTLLSQGDPVFGRFTLRALRDAETVRIELELTRDPAPENAAAVLHPLIPDSSLISEQVLIQRFCDAFGAQYRQSNTASGVSGLLTLPAADAPAAMHSTRIPYPAGNYSYCNTVLSRILTPEAFWDQNG